MNVVELRFEEMNMQDIGTVVTEGESVRKRLLIPCQAELRFLRSVTECSSAKYSQNWNARSCLGLSCSTMQNGYYFYLHSGMDNRYVNYSAPRSNRKQANKICTVRGGGIYGYKWDMWRRQSVNTEKVRIIRGARPSKGMRMKMEENWQWDGRMMLERWGMGEGNVIAIGLSKVYQEDVRK